MDNHVTAINQGKASPCVTFVKLELPITADLGDPVLGLSHRLVSGADWDLTATGAAKFALGDLERYFSSGRNNLGV